MIFCLLDVPNCGQLLVRLKQKKRRTIRTHNKFGTGAVPRVHLGVVLSILWQVTDGTIYSTVIEGVIEGITEESP